MGATPDLVYGMRDMMHVVSHFVFCFLFFVR